MKEPFSLLYPDSDTGEKRCSISDKTYKSLGLDALFPTSRSSKSLIRSLLTAPTTDPGTIQYRLDVTEDLLTQPEVAAKLWSLLPKIEELAESAGYKSTDSGDLLKLVWRFLELEAYADAMLALQKAFQDIQEQALRSEGLRELRRMTAEETNTPEFLHLTQELKRVKPGLDRMKSVTIGINLNAQLEPVQATLLSVQEERFKDGTSMVGKVLSYYGYSALNTLHTDPAVLKDKAPLNKDLNGLRQILFRDLRLVLKEVVKPLESLLSAYVRVRSQPLIHLREELLVYKTSFQLLARLQQDGLPVCRPRILPMEERSCRLRDFYNPLLALRPSRSRPDHEPASIVTNDVDFDEHGRIFLLTGPNSGGKTVYTQAVGLIQVLAQLGMFVPCREAEISPVDRIQALLEVEETPHADSGKLGVESAELHEIFQHTGAYSLVLLNETFSSTSPGESLYLMRDVVSAFRIAGVRGVFATHLHELAAQAGSINEGIAGGSRIASLVAGISADDGSPDAFARRSYKVMPGPPQGMSYAKDIAGRYGIRLEQLQDLLGRRTASAGFSES